MEKNKINAKDLINVGIFTVIYFIVFFICGMLGYIPIFVVTIPILLGVAGGIPVMLFITKTGKFGCLTLMGTIASILCFLLGQSWVSIPFGIVFGFLGDLILRSGNYKSWPKTVLGYAVFSLWVIGSMLPMWIMRDAYFEHAATIANETYLNSVMALTANWMLPVVVILGLVGGVIGAYLGKAILKKHFIRAGIA